MRLGVTTSGDEAAELLALALADDREGEAAAAAASSAELPLVLRRVCMITVLYIDSDFRLDNLGVNLLIAVSKVSPRYMEKRTRSVPVSLPVFRDGNDYLIQND